MSFLHDHILTLILRPLRFRGLPHRRYLLDRPTPCSPTPSLGGVEMVVSGEGLFPAHGRLVGAFLALAQRLLPRIVTHARASFAFFSGK